MGVLPGPRDSNMEHDEETALLSDQDRDPWRRPWQHDNAFIRLPLHFIRHVWRNPQLIWYLATIALFGVLLKQVIEGRFSGLTIMLCSMNIVCLATYSRFQAEESNGAV
ncbi:hypothetical protein V8C26DRAFT_406508 [Trichoderma gracile]